MSSDSVQAIDLAKGQQAEALALGYLKNHGLTPLAQNFHCRFGEIDLIMRAPQTLVFIEVKYRRHPHFGGALAAITARKQQKLKLTALHYLQVHRQLGNIPCRFDAVVIEGSLQNPQYQWITNILQ